MIKQAPQPKRSRKLSNGLSATFVRQVKIPGRYGDGAGLYLVVDPSGASRWMLRVQINGRRRDVGLGGTSSVGLAEARDKAHEIRRLAKLGQDPVEARRTQRDGIATFESCARAVHKNRMATWKNGKHQAQWLKTLETYAFPTIGKTAMNRIGTAEILKLLLPIWTAKPETARRVLQRIRTVIDYATASGLRSGENPTRLAVLGLPKHTDEPEHFAALPYIEAPSFMLRLRAVASAEAVKLALELLILTATRSIEVRGALKNEFDLTSKLWTIPAQRMKAGQEHQIPLTVRMIEIFEEAKELAPNSMLLFPGRKKDRSLSDMALTMVMRRLNVGATVHGFRSTFRDWVSEETDFPSEVAEMALAHAIESKVEAAYRRGKLLEKRRDLLKHWGQFCTAGALVCSPKKRRND